MGEEGGRRVYGPLGGLARWGRDLSLARLPHQLRPASRLSILQIHICILLLELSVGPAHDDPPLQVFLELLRVARLGVDLRLADPGAELLGSG